MKFRKMAIMLGISPKNQNVLLKYLGGLHHHPRKKVMLLNPKSVDKASIQVQYLENIGLKRVKISGSKQKEKYDASKEGKNKGEKDENIVATTHQCKYLRNHCNHCNIYGHKQEKCWKLHPELNIKNKKKYNKNKNLIDMDSRNQVERNSNVDAKIVCTSVQKEFNFSSLQ